MNQMDKGFSGKRPVNFVQERESQVSFCENGPGPDLRRSGSGRESALCEGECRQREEWWPEAPVCAVDLVIQYDFANRQAFILQESACILGMSGGVVENMPYSAVERGMVDPGSVEEFVRIHEAVMEGAQKAQGIAALRLSDGTAREYEITLMAALNGDKAPVQAVGIYKDIVEQREKEKRLQGTERRKKQYDSLFESVVCGIVQYTLDADLNVSFKNANQEAIRILGCTPEEFWKVDKWRLSDLIVREEKDRVLKDLQEVKNGGKKHFEYRLIRRDGTDCWICGISEQLVDMDDELIIQSVFMDVDYKKRAELENMELLYQSQASSELLQMTLKGTSFNEFYYYPQKRLCVFPPRACEKYHCRPSYEDMPESFAEEAVWEMDRQDYIAMYKRIHRGNKTAACEFRVANGTAWCSVTMFTMVRDSQGRPVCAVGLIEDITKKKNAESKRWEQAAFNQEILSSLSELFFGVYRIDLESGRIQAIRLPHEVGDVGISESGSVYSVEDISMLYHPDDRERFCRESSLENLRRKQKEGVKSLELEFRRRMEGEYRWVANIIYLNCENQRAGTAIVALMDTSERNRQSDIIQALSMEYYALYYVDVDKNCIEVIRPDFVVVDRLGMTPGMRYTQFVEAYTEKFVHPDDSAEMAGLLELENLKKSLKEKKGEHQRIYRKKVGDHYEWMRAKVILVHTESGPSQFITLAIRNADEDVRYERETKQLLEDALRHAENANAAKSDFLSKMSHDIRTPMNAIIGMTALAATHIEDKQRVLDCLSKITISSRHLLGLINEVLDMSKIESGKLGLEFMEFNLSDFIQGTILMIRPTIEEKGQELKVSIGNITHEEVVGDALRLQQVVTNILSNSNKYTQEGGLISFSLEELASPMQQCRRYQFVISDNGIGMSEEYLNHIFEPFSRADDSRISRIHGTGLGMAITQNIVHMMGGEIQVESQWGRGSRFTVTIDLHLQDSQDPVDMEFMNLPVLVADDERDARESVCLNLKSMGLIGEGVASGRQAVEKVAAAHARGDDYFAVILDWKMPEMNGMETARAIRQKVSAHIPIIILSGYDWTEIELKAREAGVDAFLSKPLFKSKLLYLFRRLSGRVNEEKRPAEDSPSPCRIDGARILLVEDNVLNLEIAREFLELAGAQVDIAADGRCAVNCFTQSPLRHYTAVLMDIQMPVMNGYEAARAIRALDREDAAEVPIIAMTADAFAEDVMRTQNAGMNAHIAKPLDIEQLMQLIRRWMK